MPPLEKTIMAIGAHHDDNEIFAGTLARHKKAGWRVVSVVATDGQWIGGKFSEDHVPIREGESLEAAKLLGMECAFMRLDEGCFEATEEARTAMIEVMRKYTPQIVMTHPPLDYHGDHMAVSRCVLEATYRTWVSRIETQSPPCDAPRLYYTDAWFVPFTPDLYVDVRDYFDLKLDMLRCHKSQLDPNNPEGGHVEASRVMSRNRGIEAGVPHAEAFRLAPKLSSVRMVELLD